MNENDIPAVDPGEPSASRPRDAAKWASRLFLVSKIARSAQATLEMGDLLNNIVGAIRKSFGFYDVSVFLVDNEAGECVLVAQEGAFDAAEIEGYRQRLGVGIVGWVAEHGQTLCANDISKEPRRIVAFEGERQIQSELAVPILLNGRAVGVINVQNREPDAFDDCDTMALETLAEQIAQAIANAQLFERTRLLRDLNRGIIDAMPSGLCVLDADLCVQYANPAFCRMIGKSADDVNGVEVRRVLGEDLLASEGLETALRQALSESRSRVFAGITTKFRGANHIVNVRIAQAHMPEGTGVLIVLEDVTLWRRAMELAEERRTHLSLIVEHVPLAILSTDLDGVIAFWGTGARELFEEGEEIVVGKRRLAELLNDEDVVRRMIETCRAGNVARDEVAVTRRDGVRVPFFAVMGRLYDRARRHVGYTVVLLDITERQRAREELLREKKKLDDVVQVIGAGLALIDRGGKIVWANRTLQEWFGRDREVEGMPCHQLYCLRDTECAICPARECFGTGENRESEVTLIRADGNLRQYHHAVTPVFGPDGNVEQVLLLTLDVTDQTKKVYQLSRLRQLGEMMQGLLDLDRVLHFVLTCVTAGQALGFNRAVLMLIDADRGIIEGKMGVGPGSAEEAGRIWSEITAEAPTLEDLLGHYDRERFDRETAMNRLARRIRVPVEDTSHILSACALGKKTIMVTNADADGRVTKDFREITGCKNFVLVPLVARNRPVGIIMADNLYSGRPISEEDVELLTMFAPQVAIAIENAETYAILQEEKVHLEKAYRDLADAQDKLVRSERLVAIGRMAAHLAHEIRNPLVTIGGFARMIQQRPESQGRDTARYAQIIAAEVQRLENILARVMDFSKPPRPLLRETALHEVIDETVEQLRERAASQKVEIKRELPAEETRLPLDPEQMKQVLLNLFQNALDVMKDGGRLTVNVETDSESALVHVVNSGELIRPEHMPSLFEPFFSTKPGGTGLGLAVSQKIVQEHGGDITATSSLAGGTRFTIRIPLTQRPRSHPQALA